MVFERGRDAEHGHHRVARELLHGAACSLDLFGHSVVEAVEQRARSLGILRAGELGGADQVCEEDRRKLSLFVHPAILSQLLAVTSLTCTLSFPPRSVIQIT